MNARWDVQKMKYDVRLVAAMVGALLAAASSLSGCAAGRWFEQADSQSSPPATAASGLKLATVTYIRQVCELPKEQRDPALRELNESVLPNHAVIYCGRGGTP
jgi:hypothetical protein